MIGLGEWKKKDSRIYEDYTSKVVYWLLKLEFLSSSPAADTEIRSENKCEEMAFQGIDGNWKENGTWSFVSLSCKDSIYEDGRGGGRACCNVFT